MGWVIFFGVCFGVGYWAEEVIGLAWTAACALGAGGVLTLMGGADFGYQQALEYGVSVDEGPSAIVTGLVAAVGGGSGAMIREWNT